MLFNTITLECPSLLLFVHSLKLVSLLQRYLLQVLVALKTARLVQSSKHYATTFAARVLVFFGHCHSNKELLLFLHLTLC